MNSDTKSKTRVLLAKTGLDAHDRAMIVIAHALRDAGMEVIYAGVRRGPEEIAGMAVQEDVDLVALGTTDGQYMMSFPQVVETLKEIGCGNIPVVGGGLIWDEDRPFLESAGVSGNYGPGTPLQVIVDHIRVRAGQFISQKGG